MKKIFLLSAIISVMFAVNGCKKTDRDPAKQPSKNENEQGHLKQTKTFSCDEVTRWLNLPPNMLRVPLAPGTGSQGADRCQAYYGIAGYESIVPKLPEYQSLTNQLTGFPEMPATEPGKAYHWAAGANAALAEMNRKLFPATSDANKTNTI